MDESYILFFCYCVVEVGLSVCGRCIVEVAWGCGNVIDGANGNLWPLPNFYLICFSLCFPDILVFSYDLVEMRLHLWLLYFWAPPPSGWGRCWAGRGGGCLTGDALVGLCWWNYWMRSALPYPALPRPLPLPCPPCRACKPRNVASPTAFPLLPDGGWYVVCITEILLWVKSYRHRLLCAYFPPPTFLLEALLALSLDRLSQRGFQFQGLKHP